MIDMHVCLVQEEAEMVLLFSIGWKTDTHVFSSLIFISQPSIKSICQGYQSVANWYKLVCEKLH